MSPRRKARRVKAGAWCEWHDGPTTSQLAVMFGETNSDSPRPLWACESCRDYAKTAADVAAFAARLVGGAS